jgi:hypothetical protein
MADDGAKTLSPAMNLAEIGVFVPPIGIRRQSFAVISVRSFPPSPTRF